MKYQIHFISKLFNSGWYSHFIAAYGYFSKVDNSDNVPNSKILKLSEADRIRRRHFNKPTGLILTVTFPFPFFSRLETTYYMSTTNDYTLTVYDPANEETTSCYESTTSQYEPYHTVHMNKMATRQQSIQHQRIPMAASENFTLWKFYIM